MVVAGEVNDHLAGPVLWWPGLTPSASVHLSPCRLPHLLALKSEDLAPDLASPGLRWSAHY